MQKSLEGHIDRRAEGDTPLRQCQLVQLHLLHLVDDICRRESIPYFLVGGTLLGAMRHDGFIPWDDDLDIGVPRREYRRFVAAMRKHLPASAIMQTPVARPQTAIPFGKVRDTGSFYCECRPDVSTAAPSGIYIDVFPYEDIPELSRPMQLLFVKTIGSAWHRAVWFRRQAAMGGVLGHLCLLLSSCCGVAHCVARVLLWLAGKLVPARSVYNLCEMGVTYRFPRNCIYPLSKHVFEDGEFPVPNDADAILTVQYGDWREVPPIEKRPCHARIIDPFRSAN